MAGTILTTIGLSKLAAATPQNQLNITHIAVGDGNGGFPTLSPNSTALTNEVWRSTASNPIKDGDNSNYVYFETNIPPEVGPFDVREIACFDIDGDMIAIGNTSLIQKPASAEDANFAVAVKIFIALENASEFDLIYQNAEVTSHNSLTDRNDAGAHTASSVDDTGGTNAQEYLNKNRNNKEAIEALYKAQGYNNVFYFVNGFTYTEPNDIGIYEDGTAWTYADSGALPVTVTAGTVPSSPDYEQVTFNDASGVLDSRGTNVQDYIDGNLTPFKTVADMQAAAYLSTLPEFTRIEWQGYYAQSDGGSNWGLLKFGTHTADGGSIFSIDDNTYVEANLTGSNINAAKFGVVDSEPIDSTQNLLNATKAANSLGIKKVYIDGFKNIKLSVVSFKECEIDLGYCNIHTDTTDAYVFTCSGECDLWGVSRAKYITENGIGEYRFINASSNSIKKLNVRDNDFGSGRVIVDISNPEEGSVFNATGNAWNSGVTNHNTLGNYLQVAIGGSLVDGGSSECQGLEISKNTMVLYGVSGSNVDAVKITGNTTGGRFYKNNLTNLNPLSNMELDTYFGASGISVSNNIFRDVSLKSQAGENIGTNDNSTMVDITANKFYISALSVANWAILRKGTSFNIESNQIKKLWPSNIPDRTFRAIWLNSTTDVLPNGTGSAREFVIQANNIDVSYSSNPNGNDIQPVAYTLKSGADPVNGSITGNMFKGGSRIYAPNFALLYGVEAQGNSWIPSAGASMPSYYANKDSGSREDITNGFVRRGGNGEYECVMWLSGTTDSLGNITIEPSIYPDIFETCQIANNSGYSGTITLSDNIYDSRSSSYVLPHQEPKHLVVMMKGGVVMSNEPYSIQVKITGRNSI